MDSTKVHLYLNERYGPLNNQDLDVFLPASGVDASKPLICVCHGGAWRVRDKHEFRPLSIRLVEMTGCAVASIDYRLSAHPLRPSQTARHPDHAEDALSALIYLLERRTERPWGDAQTARLVLLGHSCGVHLWSSILLFHGPAKGQMLRSDTAKAIRERVIGLVSSEALFDPADFLDEAPSCEGFLVEAFGSMADLKEQTWQSCSWNGRPLSVLISHAPEDELLSSRNSKVLANCLHKLSGREGDWRGEPRFEANGLRVEVDFETLHGKHDQVVQEEPLARQIVDWGAREGFWQKM